MTGKSKKLSAYKQKRDFRKSREPRGGRAKFDWAEKRPIFVIQKHDSSNLHYDFRIEADGVLVSWAVPKGPSTDPREKRLAVPAEDHPFDYSGFRLQHALFPRRHSWQTLITGIMRHAQSICPAGGET